MHVAALGQIGFIARPLHLLLAEFIYFFDSCLQLLLDRQCDFQRLRSDAFHQELPDGTIDLVSHNSLAYGSGVFDAVALADVLGHEARLAGVVADRHPAAADAKDD